MPTTRDYYEVLGVSKDVDAEEIKRAYRRLAMKHHPDRNPDDVDAEAKFKEAAEAYEVLSDENTRARYDRFGHDGLRGAGGPATHDFNRMNVEDIFSMFNDIFSGGGGGGFSGGRQQSRGVARGYDLETAVTIELEDVLAGCERDVEFTRVDLCDTCKGSGAKPGTTPEQCKTCGGQGRVMQQGLGGMFRIATTCPACRGRGSVISDPCKECHGKGRVPMKRTLTVKIPAGIHHGQAVRVRGEGEPPAAEVSPDGAGVRGDLHVAVRIKPHDGLERDGDDLLLELPINYTQAALGAEINVPTLDGEASVHLPAGAQYGSVCKVSGAGLPNLRTGRRGDLIAIAKIVVPKKLSTKHKEVLRQLAEVEEAPVRDENNSFWKKIKDKFTG